MTTEPLDLEPLEAAWAALRNGLSKAHVAADIDGALATARPRIEAAVHAAEVGALREAPIDVERLYAAWELHRVVDHRTEMLCDPFSCAFLIGDQWTLGASDD